MCAVGKPPRRSKAATLATLKNDLGKERIGHLDRHKLIEYGRKRADQGAGPVTLGIDIGVIKMILTHAAAIHGLAISPEPVDLARVALKRLGLIGKGVERDRRPTMEELSRLFRCFGGNVRLRCCAGTHTSGLGPYPVAQDARILPRRQMRAVVETAGSEILQPKHLWIVDTAFKRPGRRISASGRSLHAQASRWDGLIALKAFGTAGPSLPFRTLGDSNRMKFATNEQSSSRPPQ